MKLPILANVMLSERFIRRLFDQIAAAPDGKCPELAAFETAAAAKEDNKPTSKASGSGIDTW